MECFDVVMDGDSRPSCGKEASTPLVNFNELDCSDSVGASGKSKPGKSAE
jgi:hypothetical protein